MRRTQFLTAVITAAFTFFALQIFVGPRYWGAYGWRGGYHRHFNYYEPGYDGRYRDDYYNERDSRRFAPPAPQRDSAW